MTTHSRNSAGLLAMDRRAFMATALGAGISVSAASILWAEQAVAQTPSKGGHLKIGLDGATTSHSLDPATYSQSYDTIVGLQLFNTLTEMGNDGLEPALAESWESSPDLKTWVLKIRSGVTFHNGKTLDAEDVVASIDHHRGGGSTSAAKPLVGDITEIKATGPLEVTITLKSPNADLPPILSDYHLLIAPKGSKFTDGIGTGAFILESFEPGVRTLTKRNPNYWRNDRGFVDSVESLGINDTTARVAALLSGSIHLMNRADPKTAARLQKDQRVRLFNVSGTGFYTLSMNCIDGPYQNNDVRLAVKYATDRESIIQRIAGGFGTVANDQPIAKSDPMYSEIPQREFDLDKAKFHFQKSGHSGPLPMSVADVGFPGAVDAALIIQDSAKKAGIAIDVERVPADGYMADVFMKKPCFAAYWNGRPTANMMMSIAFASDAPWNASYWRRPAFDQLLIASRGERDEAKRKQMYRDMEMMIHEDGGELIFMFNNVMDAGGAKVQGFTPTPFAEFSGYRAPEKVWLQG